MSRRVRVLETLRLGDPPTRFSMERDRHEPSGSHRLGRRLSPTRPINPDRKIVARKREHAVPAVPGLSPGDMGTDKLSYAGVCAQGSLGGPGTSADDSLQVWTGVTMATDRQVWADVRLQGKIDRIVAACSISLVSLVAVAQPPDASIAAQPTRALDGAAASIELDPVDGAVLVLAFSRGSSRQIEGWTHQLNAALACRSHVPGGCLRFYNVIVLARMPGLVRGLIRRAIRSGVPKERQGKYRIVEHGDVFWRALATVDDADQAYVLRVDSFGRVCARQVGPVTAQALADILDARCASAPEPG